MEAEAKRLIDAETWEQTDTLRKDVRRDRDRLNASSLGLMFLDQPATHPHRLQQLIWNEPSYFGEAMWLPPLGEWLCAIGAPTQDGSDFVLYQVFFDGVYFGSANDACRKFREHACEIAALCERLGHSNDVALSREEVLVRTLFNLNKSELLWEENEQPGHPETKSRIARLKDVYGLTEMFLKVLLELYVPDSPNLPSPLAPKTEASEAAAGDTGKFVARASTARIETTLPEPNSESVPRLVVILEQLGWRVFNNRRRLSRLSKRLQQCGNDAQITPDFETRRKHLSDELARYEDMLNDCAAWIRVRTGIPENQLIEVAMSTVFAEGEERDNIYADLRKLDEGSLTAELWEALLSQDRDALVSVRLLPSSESSPPAAVADEHRGDPADETSSPPATKSESDEQGGASNHDRRSERRLVEREPAFERFSNFSYFTDIAQELLHWPDGLPLPRDDGFEGNPYFSKSDITKLLTEVRRYCPDFSSQRWLTNPDPSVLLIEMELALERRKNAEASGEGGKSDGRATSTPDLNAEATANSEGPTPAQQLAFDAFDYAREKEQNPELTPRQAYEFWTDGKRGLAAEDRDEFPQLKGYDPGKFSSYETNLSKAANHPAINQPRYGKRKGNLTGQKRRNGQKMIGDNGK